MKRKLDWPEVLNDQTRWRSGADLQSWFDEVVGRRTNLLEGSIEGFVEALGFMRRSVAHIHFEEPVDLLWLDTQLKTVTLGLLHYQGAQEGNNGQLPRLRARVKGMLDSDLLRALKDTLLIHFAEYVGAHLDGTAVYVVARCEGLYKSALPLFAGCAESDEIEQRYRAEIPFLRAMPVDLQVHRCPNLFVHSGKQKYCTDACRFTTAQLAQELDLVDALKPKPRRYRRAEKQAKNV